VPVSRPWQRRPLSTGRRVRPAVGCGGLPSPLVALTVVAGLFWLAPPPARAQAPDGATPETGSSSSDSRAERDEMAREHFVVGRRYFEEARYPEAAREFSEAYRLSGRSELLLNLALAEERALDYDAAIAAILRYLEVEPGTPDRPELEERISRLEGLREEEEERVRRRAAELAAGDGDGTTSAAGGGPRAGRGGPSTFQWVGVGLLIGAGALGGAALGTGLAAETIYDDLDASQNDDGFLPPDRLDDRDRGRRLAAASTGLTFAAAGLAIGGLVLVLVGGEEHGGGDDGDDGDEARDGEAGAGTRGGAREARPQAPRWSVSVGPRSAGFLVRGSF